ncbi:MAG TPA: glycoside hydrolase family 3 N-terminal domain-containing protein [Acidimicrobiia bacterium]|nr:glycoside hydrolase family 3 N-terminal domain-containing protein [Acidimicrobiia bacterium]
MASGDGAATALIAFEGLEVDQGLRQLLADPRVGGVTLYRSLNIDNAEQTQRLTRDIQEAAGRQVLIAVDQEGGQLTAAGPETTHFAGNMALGATRDPTLAKQIGRAIGIELAALGITVNYAPVADVASRPWNPSLGIRAFGEDPALVGVMTAAMVAGIQSAGVAATIKHFPGKGEATVDPHHGLPVLDLELSRLEQVEFPPFRAGIEAGARLLMVGHYGLPAVIGDRTTPTSISEVAIKELIRGLLGFEGVIITDALDMGGFGSASTDLPLVAGADLLLYGPAQIGSLPSWQGESNPRLQRLLAWLSAHEQPPLTAVGSADHRSLAGTLARRALTLVRDTPGLLPIQIGADDRILAVMPRPTDLTPADTSSMVPPGLASAIRTRHRPTTEVVVDQEPSQAQVRAALQAAADHDLIVAGTIDAGPGQAELVGGLVATGKPVVAVAMRTPYDLARYPSAGTYVCTYGIHPPSMEALVAALFGEAPMTGCLPAAVPGLYPVGHAWANEKK